MKIYGAGFAGLLAGCMFQNADIFEAGDSSQAQHKAVLRFRSRAVGDAVGIDFKPVKVHKGIWFSGAFVQPTIQNANWYSKKVVGQLADRSIWNIDTAERFIAPETFLNELAERCGSRVHWNHRVTSADIREYDKPAISTLPMPLVAKFIMDESAPQFQSSPIVVRRWRIPGANVHQTIYFPDMTVALYRASITGDLLIAEHVADWAANQVDQAGWDKHELFRAFGLNNNDAVLIDDSKQTFGKILPIDEQWRKAFMFKLTQSYKIYSLGRFGTWRNILLDDVINDLAVIKKLMRSGAAYDHARHVAISG